MIIGLGTGRCGTKTLATLLGLPHELRFLPWLFHGGRFHYAISQVERVGDCGFGKAFDYTRGDVGFYWLPYVNAVLQRHPCAKFVCIQRERDATVRSFAKIMAGTDKFVLYTTFTDAEGKVSVPSSLPDYGLSVEDSIPRYYDEYYKRASRIQDKHPESFRIFPMETVFSDAVVQQEMLDFCGSERPINLDILEHGSLDRDRVVARNRVDALVGRINGAPVNPYIEMDVSQVDHSVLAHLSHTLRGR